MSYLASVKTILCIPHALSHSMSTFQYILFHDIAFSSFSIFRTLVSPQQLTFFHLDIASVGVKDELVAIS